MTALTVAMTEHEARRVTERIRAIAVTVKDQLEKLQTLLNEARDGEAWRVLGYASWTAYLADVMGEQPLRLPRDERQQIVGYLAGEGMSSRAIAPIVGASPSQVKRDAQVAQMGQVPGVTNVPPEPAPTADYVTDQTDLDAAPELPDEGVGAPHDSGDAEPSEDEGLPLPSPSSRSVTGLDGKQYARPEPQTPKRTPLTEAFWKATYDLQKVTERLERLQQDDRFDRNKNEVAARNGSYLAQAQERLDALMDALNN